MATAARASGSTIARLPPVALPSPPGSCTLCVASNTTGVPSACISDERPHVVDQPAVAEERAPFAEQDIAAAGGFELADDVPHVARGEELGLFDVDGPAGAGGRDQQIGLPGEKGGNLQQVADLGRRRRPGTTRECRS